MSRTSQLSTPALGVSGSNSQLIPPMALMLAQTRIIFLESESAFAAQAHILPSIQVPPIDSSPGPTGSNIRELDTISTAKQSSFQLSPRNQNLGFNSTQQVAAFNHVNSSVQPSSNSTQPSRNSAQPSRNSTQPASISTQPSSDSSQPSRNSSQPSRNSTQPSSNSTKPASNATQPEISLSQGLSHLAPVFTPRSINPPPAIEPHIQDIIDSFQFMGECDDSPEPPPCTCHHLPRGSCPRFIEEIVNQTMLVRQSGLPNMDGLRSSVSTELIPAAWDTLLKNYFDHDELLNGVRFGMDLSFNGDPSPRNRTTNHPSAMQHMEDIDKYVAKELQFGALVGPLPAHIPFPVFASPLASVPKPKTNSTRTITDCSQGSSGINTWIDAHLHRGKYWQIKLPTGDTIKANIARVRKENPGKKVLLF